MEQTELQRAAEAILFAAGERLDTRQDQYDADDLLLYDGGVSLAQLAEKVRELKNQGRSVLVQRTVPENIRVRRILKLAGGEVTGV
jgi:hypothetical protein